MNLNVMGFRLLKEKKYKRCWRAGNHLTTGRMASQLGFLCGFWSHLILKLGFSKPLK